MTSTVNPNPRDYVNDNTSQKSNEFKAIIFVAVVFIIFAIELIDQQTAEMVEFANSNSQTVIEEGEEIDDCSICLDGFIVGQPVRRLACSHAFHPHCIGQWLNSQQGLGCPNCRRLVV